MARPTQPHSFWPSNSPSCTLLSGPLHEPPGIMALPWGVSSQWLLITFRACMHLAMPAQHRARKEVFLVGLLGYLPSNTSLQQPTKAGKGAASKSCFAKRLSCLTSKRCPASAAVSQLAASHTTPTLHPAQQPSARLQRPHARAAAAASSNHPSQKP